MSHQQPGVFCVYLEKNDNMKNEDFEKIVKDLEDLKNLPNSKLIETMDSLTTEFELIKSNIIGLTHYLDKVEEFYNKLLSEYQTRNNGK